MKLTYGPDDDPNGLPTHVEEAFGVIFDPPLPQKVITEVIVSGGRAAKEYVDAVVEATKKLMSVVPADPQLKLLCDRMMERQIKQHAEHTGQTITFVRGAPKQKELTTTEYTSQHKELVKKYKANRGALPDGNTQRGRLLLACEKLVLERDSKARTRTEIRVTPRDLLDHVANECSDIHKSLRELLLPTLVDDGWRLFMVEDEVRILPYGEDVPGYDASLIADEHPMWSRDKDAEWDIWQ